MKKIFFLLLALIILDFPSIAQCPQASATVLTTNHGEVNEPGAYNSFGVRITLNQVNSEDVTVTGVVYDSENQSVSENFSITVTAGYLTNEEDDLLISGRESYAQTTINSISPCPVSSLIETFKSLNPTTLQSTDTVALAAYFAPINSVIVNYVYAKYGEDLNSICDGEQDWITLYGFIIAMCENYYDNGDSLEMDETANIGNRRNQVSFASISSLIHADTYISKFSPLIEDELMSEINFKPKWVNCAIATLTGISTIETLLMGYGSLGATQVLSIIKGIARRYLGFIGVVVAIYEFGECMDYW